MKCKNCYYDLEPRHIHFCPNCGKHVDFEPKEQEQHEAGEPFNDKFEYSGEYRLPTRGDWYVTPTGAVWAACADGVYRTNKYILQSIGTHAKSQVRTTVTVWRPLGSGSGNANGYPCEYFWKGTYSFSGTPDIDCIISETKLGKKDGALAIKIECDEAFEYVTKSLLLWKVDLGLISWSYDGYKAWKLDAKYKYTYDDSQIEAAITEYLKDDIKVEDIVFIKGLKDLLLKQIANEVADMEKQIADLKETYQKTISPTMYARITTEIACESNERNGDVDWVYEIIDAYTGE